MVCILKHNTTTFILFVFKVFLCFVIYVFINTYNPLFSPIWWTCMLVHVSWGFIKAQLNITVMAKDQLYEWSSSNNQFYFIIDDKILQLFIKCQLTLTRCPEGMEETVKNNIVFFFIICPQWFCEASKKSMLIFSYLFSCINISANWVTFII